MKASCIFLFIQIATIFSYGAIPYRLTIEDPKKELTPQQEIVLKNFDAAISEWAKFISSQGELWIHLRVTKQTPRLQGGSIGYKEVEVKNGKRIFEFSASYKMRTGQTVDPKQPDILILINPDVFASSLEIDPNPLVRSNPIPRWKLDLVSAFVHELGHGFGIQGFLDYSSLAPMAENMISIYDTFVNAVGEELFFVGPNAKKVNGFQPVPLTFCKGQTVEQVSRKGKDFYLATDSGQNIYHLGHCHDYVKASDNIFYSIMGGVWPFEIAASGHGVREFVTPLEAAILLDLGIPQANQ